eukprot:361929-Chlamydomonas_euryale.AAC.1
MDQQHSGLPAAYQYMLHNMSHARCPHSSPCSPLPLEHVRATCTHPLHVVRAAAALSICGSNSVNGKSMRPEKPVEQPQLTVFGIAGKLMSQGSQRVRKSQWNANNDQCEGLQRWSRHVQE